jgi:hypothetical protein
VRDAKAAKAGDGVSPPPTSGLLGLGAERRGDFVGDATAPQSGEGATQLGSEGNRNGKRGKDGRGKHTIERHRVHQHLSRTLQRGCLLSQRAPDGVK